MSRKWVFVLPENQKRDVRPPLLAKGVVCIGRCAEKILPFCSKTLEAKDTSTFCVACAQKMFSISQFRQAYAAREGLANLKLVFCPRASHRRDPAFREDV